jgi:hypothetical protein
MYLAVAEGFEPSHGRINNAVPYQLGYATRTVSETRRPGESAKTVLSPGLPFSVSPCRTEMEAMKGVEPLSSGLQDRRSDIQLSYIAK